MRSRGARRLLALAGLGTVLALASLAKAEHDVPAPPGEALPPAPVTTPSDPRQPDGASIVAEAERRHAAYPYVYEEQTMVLMDGTGSRRVRKCRRFSRIEADGSVRLLLVFDAPEEIRGVALLARRDADGRHEQAVYLPAFGPELRRPSAGVTGGNFLGTDLAVADLVPDLPGEFRYVRGEDRTIDEVDYYVVDAYPASREVERRTGYGMRRLRIRKDNLVIAVVDYYDRRLRLRKRLARHDLARVDDQGWRANMIAVHDERDRHRTLLKVDRRVYSADYVPAAIFEPGYLLANRHLTALDARVAGRPVPSNAPPAVPAPGAPPAEPGSGTGPRSESAP